MKLTTEEKEMLDGKYGDGVQKAMELLVAVGDCYDAERMVPVASAHPATLTLEKAGHSLSRVWQKKEVKF